MLEIVTEIDPAANTALEGLYVSDGIFCTQCEAQGFRHITFYPDRPDVMAPFRVRIEGDRAAQPILLAGGNVLETGDLPDSRHYAVFEDPFPKPCYLFAVVAGDLDHIADSFTTMSGREVRLGIYTDKGEAGKAKHAMIALKASMAWDEKVYGREYHLDVFSIVAVQKFNMGAMENTGLNIFNAAYVLADADTATDTNLGLIEAVIAHEYFHNWSGNRVTCRDCFQLTLKEGFTVFRDHQFSSDLNDRAVTRLNHVDSLKSRQFAEDAGPTGASDSALIPTSRSTISIRRPSTRKAGRSSACCRSCWARNNSAPAPICTSRGNDGQAVTCEDFVAALEDASGADLTRFRRWYSQVGTPTLSVRERYDAATRTYTLSLRQESRDAEPLVMPVAIGLLGANGEEMPLRLAGGGNAPADVLQLAETAQDFVFKDVAEKPVLSVLRGFSAPVNLDYSRPDSELTFLMRHDQGWLQPRAGRFRAGAAQPVGHAGWQCRRHER